MKSDSGLNLLGNQLKSWVSLLVSTECGLYFLYPALSIKNGFRKIQLVFGLIISHWAPHFSVCMCVHVRAGVHMCVSVVEEELWAQSMCVLVKKHLECVCRKGTFCFFKSAESTWRGRCTCVCVCVHVCACICEWVYVAQPVGGSTWAVSLFEIQTVVYDRKCHRDCFCFRPAHGSLRSPWLSPPPRLVKKGLESN